jgi:uncharacterized protein YndB with AHSA1/START domain
MQNAKNETKKYDLQIEKLISKPPTEVFRAIGEGRLFLNCSASNETLKVDFRVGGKYHIDFKGYGFSNHGQFLEITPYQKIVFTWCQNTEANNKPDTTVTIQLKEQGTKTHLTLTHEGFKDQEKLESHQGGWNSGLNDLAEEMIQGKLRIVRLFKLPAQKLYEKCKDPVSFFGMMGDMQKGKVDFKVDGHYQVPTEKGEIHGTFLEIVPNEKIVFTWESSPSGEKLTHGTKVTLEFEREDDEESWLTIIHEKLDTESQQKTHRMSWDMLLNRIMGEKSG